MNLDDLQKIATFGIAGNFAEHLEQAGEAIDFSNIITKEKNEPKAIFPTFIPVKNPIITPKFLTEFPFDSDCIIYPKNEQKIQLEPECAIIFQVEYLCDLENPQRKIVKSLKPLFFTASNDCSIRKEGAKKISQKKNWGKSSKGVSSNFIPFDDFSSNGVLSKYKIASFMIHDNKIFEYGEDSSICDYNYIFEKLENWIIEKLNFQQDFGPTEKVNLYLQEADFPQQILISIGATRYTEFGKTHFLQKNDESIVVLYPKDKYDFKQIKTILEQNGDFLPEVSVLRQKIL